MFFEFFAKRHLFANLFTFLVFVAGAMALTVINRNTFPEVDFGEMTINTVYPGASPEDVELKVTNKIEEEIDGISGIKSYTSFSIENRSFIHIKLVADEPDQDSIKQEIRDAVNQVTDLPPEVEESPLITELKTSIFPVIEIGIAGDDLDYEKLRQIAWAFEKKLEHINGIATIKKFGWRAREVNVLVEPSKIQKLQISLREIIDAIKGRNIRSTGGAFESYTSERNIVTLAQFEEPSEVGDVIVRSTFEGPAIKINDLAVVEDGFEDEDIISRINGKAAISFIPYKTSSADIIKTVDRIRALVEEEEKLLPEGVEIRVANDFSTYLRNRFQIVISNGALGLLFIVFFLSIFLNLRTAFWVSLSIPLMMLGVIFILNAAGFALDAIMLMALILVLGIVVDDAIIVSESIYREFENGEEPLQAAVKGIKRVYAPVLTTILTTFAAFAPMFFMPGTMGKFTRVIPLTVTLALIVSLIEVTIALPAHLAPGLKKRKNGGGERNWFNLFRKPYEGMLKCFIRGPFRYITVCLFVGVLATSTLYASKYMRFELFPKETADVFSIEIELETGSSLEATSEAVKPIEKVVTQIPKNELDSFVTRIGQRGADPFLSDSRENFATIIVYLEPYGNRKRDVDAIISEMREKTDKISGFKKLTYQVDGGGPPVGDPITVRAISSDDKIRKLLADRIEEELSNVDGVLDLNRDDVPGKEQIEINLNYEVLARSNLSVQEVSQTVRTAYDGEVVTNVRYGEEDVDFRVRLVPEARKGLDYLKSLLIRNSEGRLVPLSKVADFVVGPGPSNYYHYNGERSVTVTGDIDKAKTTSLDATNAALSKINIRDYPGAWIIVGGEAEETAESIGSLKLTMAIAGLAIYFLLVLLFNSFSQPLLVMAAVPFGVSGVIITFALHDAPLGFLSMLGVIGLIGVVVNDSLVLVNHLNLMREEDPQMSIFDIAIKGAGDRLRPIVLTSITTIAGLLPLAYGVGGSDPFLGYMALALGWGLLLATPLTLILLPCLFVIFDDFSRLGKFCLRRSGQ